jgi:membrane-bound lytic murein transglycosylase D
MTVARSAVLCAVVAALAAGCAHGKPGVAAKPSVAPPVEDPVARLVAIADRHLAAGMAESQAGHLRRAREEFDLALDVYLGAPGGALAEPRLAAAYRRTLEAVQLQELEVLAAGDGFSEAPPEPAAIDDVADLAPGGLPSAEAQRLAEEALRGEANPLGITLNYEVLSCIELYQGELRDWFASALARGGRYLPRIREVFAARGIPQDLAYVALVESAFKTGALSRAKAKGLWQFIPGTGRRFGLRQDWWVDERSSPEKATVAAAEYLTVLYEMFKDWNLALASYNAGEGRVLRAVDGYGTGDFWELSRMGALPRETRNYVPMIHAAILVARAPEAYGFSGAQEAPFRFDTVAVHGATDLRLVAECAGSDLQDLRQLNPELRRMATPANRSHSVRVPTGTGKDASDCLRSTPPEKRVAFRTHVVGRGQTFSSLAKQYGTSAREIAEANGLRTSKRLARGTELIIPVRAEARRTAVRTSAPAERLAAEGARGTPLRYRVRRGDTLFGIASRFNTTVLQLQQWNKGLSSRLVPGRTLTLYTLD